MGLVLEMYLVGRDWNQNTDADWQQCGTQEDHPRDRVEGPPGQSMEAEGLLRDKSKTSQHALSDATPDLQLVMHNVDRLKFSTPMLQ